jgi:hypothetical protein
MLLLPSGTVAFTSAVNPGFRTILTQKGLNYANGVAFPLLKERISNFSIQNFTKSFKVPIIGMITFTLTNAKILSLNFGDSSMTLGKNGLTLVDNGISLALSADWSYDTVYGAPMNTSASGPNVKDHHGTVDVSGRGISLKMTVDMTMNKSSGGIHLNCSYCSVGIDHLSVKFHGGASWFLNIVSSVVENFFKTSIEKKICSMVVDTINTDGNNALAKLINLTYAWNGVEIDYALVADPDFTHSGVVIVDNKGEFRLGKDPQDPPFPPPPFPDPSLRNFSKMIYLQGSTYVAESASWAFWKAGLLSYNVSNEQIPTGFKTTGFYCAIVSPELCKKYPNKKVMFGVVASDYPRLKITPEYAVAMGKALASMYVENNGHEELAFTLALDIQADMKLWFNSSSPMGPYLVCGNVSNPKVNMSLYKSNIGNFNCSTLNDLVTKFAPTMGLGYLNDYLNAGIPIPTLVGLSFVDPSLTFGKGYVEVSGDVQYSPEILEKLRRGQY